MLSQSANSSCEPWPTVVVGFGRFASGTVSTKRARQFYSAYSHAEILAHHPCFTWSAVVDPSEEARSLAQKSWGIPLTAALPDDVAKEFRPTIAVLATPPEHRLAAIEAFPDLRAVIVEKPLGRDLAEAKRFLDLCKDRRIAVQVNLFRRADPRFKDLAQGGLERIVGHPQAVNAVYGNGLKNTGSHMVDLFRMLFGPITATRCLAVPQPDSDLPLTDDLHASFALTHQSGLITTAQALDFRHYRENALDIWGTSGRLTIRQELTDFRHFVLAESRMIEGRKEIQSDTTGIQVYGSASDGYRLIYDNLAAFLVGKEPLVSPGHSAFETEVVLDAILWSGRNGCQEYRFG